MQIETCIFQTIPPTPHTFLHSLLVLMKLPALAIIALMIVLANGSAGRTTAITDDEYIEATQMKSFWERLGAIENGNNTRRAPIRTNIVVEMKKLATGFGSSNGSEGENSESESSQSENSQSENSESGNEGL